MLPLTYVLYCIIYITRVLEVASWGVICKEKHLEENNICYFKFEDFLPQLKGCCPRLAEVTSIVCNHDSCSVRLLMEGLFAHFFSPYRKHYNTEDIQWFLELANEQEQWEANPLEHDQQQKHYQSVTKVGHLFCSVHAHAFDLKVDSTSILASTLTPP